MKGVRNLGRLDFAFAGDALDRMGGGDLFPLINDDYDLANF